MGNHPSASENFSNIFITTNTFATVNISTAETLPIHLKSSIDQKSDVDSSIQIALPPEIQCSNFVKEPKAILIRSTEPISVQISDNNNIFTSELTTLFPVEKLTKSYIISSYRSLYNQAAIAAYEDETEVKIILKLPTGRQVFYLGRSYRNLDILEISLQKLETFQFYSFSSDLSGTRIESNKQVAVFSGSRCVRLGSGACSHTVEQMPPISLLGKTFIAPPNLRRPQTLVRILSPTKTDVTISMGGQIQNRNINENEHTDISLTDEQIVVIESTNPILVTSLAFGSSNFDHGDPYLTVVPGKSHYLEKYKVFVPPGYTKNYIAIMIETAAKSSIVLNREPIEMNSIRLEKQQTVNSTEFTTLVVEVGSGELIVQSDKVAFGLMVYGQRRFDGYGFAGNVLSP
ncbi:IgGFc-binding protein-like [Saccostrea echinata]|uniref:IgGFc-binding protein-like n=1 Tax=Saccostrea echinata TaxID=191078 RepID=UPI002A7FCF83|nr:IgGFc-binding protein-like [Saccostrea echinata]